MRPLRRDVQMIFQDPYSSLNPRHTVGTIVAAPFRLQGVEPEGGVKTAGPASCWSWSGLNPEHYNRYPHEFSGGQRQRIGIARALALRAEAGRRRRAGLRAGRVDPGAGRQPARRPPGRARPDVRVHRARPVGRPARLGPDRGDVPRQDRRARRPRRRCTRRRMHPYTKALMSAVPVPDPRRRAAKSERILLKGDVPSPIDPPSGCRFHTRCWKATEICATQEPPLLELKPGQQVACHHPENPRTRRRRTRCCCRGAKEAAELVPDERAGEVARPAEAAPPRRQRPRGPAPEAPAAEVRPRRRRRPRSPTEPPPRPSPAGTAEASTDAKRVAGSRAPAFRCEGGRLEWLTAQCPGAPANCSARPSSTRSTSSASSSSRSPARCWPSARTSTSSASPSSPRSPRWAAGCSGTWSSAPCRPAAFTDLGYFLTPLLAAAPGLLPAPARGAHPGAA